MDSLERLLVGREEREESFQLPSAEELLPLEEPLEVA